MFMWVVPGVSASLHSQCPQIATLVPALYIPIKAYYVRKLNVALCIHVYCRVIRQYVNDLEAHQSTICSVLNFLVTLAS